MYMYVRDINLKWLDILNSDMFKNKDFINSKNEDFTLEDLLVWYLIDTFENRNIPAYRSLIGSVLKLSDRTISRRFSKLASFGLITYKYYGGVMNVCLKVKPNYDFQKFNGEYEKLNGQENIIELFNKVYKEMKGGNF